MAKLSSKQRDNLPDSAFALVFKDSKGETQRMFPIYDKNHAVQALRMAPRALKAGTISRSQYNTVVAKAKAKLGPGK